MFQSGGNTGGGLFGQSGSTSSNLFGAKPAASTGFGSAQAQPSGASNTNNTAGGFGSANQAPASGFGSGFGAASNNNNNNSTFGAQPSNTQTGGLFGNNNASTGGGLFGNKPAGTTPAPGTTGATTGGLFGNNNASTGTTGGLFGAKPAATTAPSTGGLFGGTNNASSTTSGGLFGGNSASTNTSGGLFGNKPATGGGLFGGATQSTSGGLFGNSANNNANTTATTGGLFGANQNQNQNQQQQPQQQQSTGLFGSNNTTNNAQPSFNWSNSQQPVPTSTISLSNLNNANNSAITQASVNQANNAYKPAINDQLIKIKEQWDPSSPKCALKTHFYNKYNEQEINVLLNQQRPQNETHEDWENAMNKRPSALHYPIKITSFTEVAQRIETQLEHVAKSRLVLNDINEKANTLSSKHDLDNTTRILKAKAKHTKLSRRLLRLATVLAILKLKGYPLLPEEEEISKQFEVLNSKLNDPNSPIGKLNDIFARLATLKERAEDLNYQFDHTINSFNGEDRDDKSGDQNDGNTQEIFNKLSKVLMKQQIGLNYLNEVLERDTNSVEQLTQRP
ncbi:uncharacterized protein CANTADRAFT_74718 [Suhomyces tanzawaensis NRRL Y-17324]|uniref:Nucleoporin Nup54 alpha-helical domain-containing protein n=1 Tax=Suhomyces tanzawaensis NRRL Y-17324 TaxID=984487 RepID=A0A1E4SRK9_9ASCO|nr:uncharacterized protein CANTADRAFT_74718 [Suhomyces tanzawaensis NRRL Y-17324]ODV82146.1 hypothetical protein CANTADRAFT_74718 [Suhomyces tanzawaensis NRRL Y-17324]